MLISRVQVLKRRNSRSPHSLAKSLCFLEKLYFTSFSSQCLLCAQSTHLPRLLYTRSNYHLLVVTYNRQKYKPQLLVTLSCALSNQASATAATVPLYILLTWQGNVSLKHFILCFCDLHYTLNLIIYQCC